MSNFSQIQVFICFYIIGIIIGIIFNFFKELRKVFKTSDIITFFEDLFFLICTGVLIVFGILKLNNGEVRFFLFLGIGFGIISYILTIGKMCDIIFHIIFISFKKCVCFLKNIK